MKEKPEDTEVRDIFRHFCLLYIPIGISADYLAMSALYWFHMGVLHGDPLDAFMCSKVLLPTAGLVAVITVTILIAFIGYLSMAKRVE